LLNTISTAIAEISNVRTGASVGHGVAKTKLSLKLKPARNIEQPTKTANYLPILLFKPTTFRNKLLISSSLLIYYSTILKSKLIYSLQIEGIKSRQIKRKKQKIMVKYRKKT